jgi:hypothetical protein
MEDFGHLIRVIFEKELSAGSEVKIPGKPR